MKHLGDITKINGSEIEPVDVITFGAPCQDLSQAGKRLGLKHKDHGDDETTRSGLFYEAIRIIKEMRANERRHHGRTGKSVCRYSVYENVPGALSSNGGEDWRCVLEAICRVKDESANVPRPEGGKWSKCGSIMGDGYSLAWKITDAQYWGVPQRRRRLALVADYCGYTAADILLDPQYRGETASTEPDQAESDSRAQPRSEVQPLSSCLPRHSESGGETGQGASTSTAIGTGSSSGTSGLEPVPIEGNGQRESHRGNGYGNEGDPMFTLNSTEHHAVAAEAYGICSYDSNAMKSPNPNSGFYKADTSRTLDLNGGSPACNQGGVAVVEVAEPTVCNGENVTSPLNKTNPQPGDPCHTLGTDTRNYVVDATYCPEIAHTLSARHDGSPQPDKGNGAEVVAVGVDIYNHAVTGDVACALTAVGAGDPTKSGSSVLSAGFSFGQSAKARSIGYAEEVSPTLRGGEGGNQKPCVLDATAISGDIRVTPGASELLCIEMTSTKNTVVDDGISPTLTARMGTGGNQVNAVYGCYQNTGQGWWNESDVGATVRTPCGGDSTKANLVAAVGCRNATENPDINGTLQSKETGQNLNTNGVVRTGEQRGGGAYMSVVRRLTPLE